MSDAEVREWAYDWEVELIEQDEDLLLHDLRYMQVLAECVRDAACPKSEYIISIIGSFCQLRLLHRRVQEAHAVVETIRVHLGFLGGERLVELGYLLPVYEQLVSPKAMSHTEADNLAHDLLIRHSARSLVVEPELAGHRVYTYDVPYKPFFYVALSTGTWRYSPMQRLAVKDLLGASAA
jgi:hypothetical protein